MGDADNDEATPRRLRKMRFNPFRDVLPWVAIAVGSLFTFRAATGNMDPVFLITGPILTVLGLVAFFVFRWMAKRNI